MVLFVSSMFGWLYEMYNKTTVSITRENWNRELKYIYRVKNVDENRQKQKKVFITMKK